MAVKKPSAAPKPSTPKPTPRPPQQSQTDGGNGNEGGDGGADEANVFDKVAPQGSVAPGKYEAIITEMVLQDADEKGRSARIKVEVATEGEQQGNAATQWYKLFEADGSAGKGAAFLKRDLAMLGYPDVKFGDLEAVFDEITEKKPGVLIQVKQNGQFTNVYLNGLCEDDDNVNDYRDNRPNS